MTFLLLWANLYELTPVATRMLFVLGINASMQKVS